MADRVSMPMASAGLIGMSSDMKIAGREIDPKVLVIVVFLVVIVVNLAAIAIR